MSLGSGLSLDENWDLEIASDGDVASVEGSDELQKDLAFNVGRLLIDSQGGVVTDGDLSDIEIRVEQVLASDPRVAAVLRVEADTQLNSDGDTSVAVESEVETVTDEVLEQIFEV